MILVKLQGGLGNQMFQYALGLTISRKLKRPLYFDTSFFRPHPEESDITPRYPELDIFNNTVAIADDKTVAKFTHPKKLQRVLNRFNIGNKNIYRENSLRFDNSVFNVSSDTYFEGYWQSQRYFAATEELLRETFTFKKRLNSRSKELAIEIAAGPNAVSIHVRRGDYISSERTNQIHGTCSVGYYLKAIETIKSKTKEPHFYIFSDEPEWAANILLPILDKATIVDHNKAADNWQDMALMSKCKHHIIANSSFSWWGAWLNPNKDKIVIAPEHWFKTRDDYFDDKDIVPNTWIKIANV